MQLPNPACLHLEAAPPKVLPTRLVNTSFLCSNNKCSDVLGYCILGDSSITANMTHRIPAFPYLCLSCLHFLITPGIQNQGILDTAVKGQLCAINPLSDMCFQEVELRSSGDSAVFMLRDFTRPSMITYFLRSIITLHLCFTKVLLFVQSIGKLRNKIFLRNFPPLF